MTIKSSPVQMLQAEREGKGDCDFEFLVNVSLLIIV